LPGEQRHGTFCDATIGVALFILSRPKLKLDTKQQSISRKDVTTNIFNLKIKRLK
jgi:hypothetical protein